MGGECQLVKNFKKIFLGHPNLQVLLVKFEQILHLKLDFGFLLCSGQGQFAHHLQILHFQHFQNKVAEI